jgi:hypothetical protein
MSILTILNVPAYKTELVGSYGRAIPSSSGTTYADYNQKDIDKTIDALIATGQTLYGFPADDGTAGNIDGYWWPQFLELLQKTVNTNIKIFAIVKDRHLYVGANRWGVVGAKLRVDRSTDAASANGWAAAATELSAISATYPHLVGFTIDDFGPVYDPYWGGYSAPEILAITVAAKSSNNSFKFWPTQYFSQMLKQVVPSTAIGITKYMPMSKDEYVATEYSFNIVNVPTTAVLSFLMNDGNKDSDPDPSTPTTQWERLDKIISVNGTAISTTNSSGFQFVEIFEQDIVSNIHVGTNVIRIEVKANKNITNDYFDKLLYVEDPKILIDGVTVPTMVQSFDRLPLYDGENMGHSGSVITRDASGHTYADQVDGFFAVYSNNSTFDNRVLTLVQKYKAVIGDKELHYVDQGYLYDLSPPISSTSIVNKMMTVSGHCTSLLVWNWPIDLYDQTAGVFSQKDLWTMPDGSMHFRWPRYHATVPGIVQTWTTIAQYSGTAPVKVKDNYTDTGTYFQKRIFTSAGTTLYIDSTADAEAAADTAESFNIIIGPTPVNISFEVSEIGSVGDLTQVIEFGIQIDGIWLEQSDFTFVSTTNNVTLISAYQDIVDYFVKPSWLR